MRYYDLIDQINTDINTNGEGKITGAKLNDVLNEMVAVLGNGFRIAGEIAPDSLAPSNPENGMCYIATAPGTYTHFGGVQVGGYEVAFIYYDGNGWSKMGWPHKDYGLVIVDSSTMTSFGDDEMAEIRKDVCFIVRNDADGIPGRLFVKDRDENSMYYFYAAPLISETINQDMRVRQSYIEVNQLPHGGRYDYTVSGLRFVIPSHSNMVAALSAKQDTLTFDTAPTADSTNPVTSGGIKSAIDKCIQKSQTAGLVKNDGTIDTTQYGTYSKPSGGIPSTDLATAVQTSLGKADTALQSYTETDPVFSASAAAGITSSDISDWDGKAEPTPVVDASSQAPSTMEPNTVYRYGTLSGDTTFPAFATPASASVANVWCWTFTTPSTAPTITWPAGITAWAGGSAPTINASKSYEVSVMDGLALIVES